MKKILIPMFVLSMSGCTLGMGVDDPGNVGPTHLVDSGSDAEEDGSVACIAEGYAEGCPCYDAGWVVDCGTVYVMNGSYVTCAEGYAACMDAQWGKCVGNNYIQNRKVPFVRHKFSPKM